MTLTLPIPVITAILALTLLCVVLNMQDEHTRAALEGLRSLVRALDDQMELLRDQV